MALESTVCLRGHGRSFSDLPTAAGAVPLCAVEMTSSRLPANSNGGSFTLRLRSGSQDSYFTMEGFRASCGSLMSLPLLLLGGPGIRQPAGPRTGRGRR